MTIDRHSARRHLLVFLVLLLLLPPDGVHPLPQRRPVRITPFLYSDALNVAAVRSSADSMRGNAMDWPKSGWDGQQQAMLQITPFFYSSAKRRRD
uniref:Secreted protein n=1 Tax=Globodera pallida TaxID=36090 RepID=A0A183CC67_GLOPA